VYLGAIGGHVALAIAANSAVAHNGKDNLVETT
jgi:hypothetical protein